MRIEILRFEQDSKQTLAKFIVFDDWNCEVTQGYVLELPDKENQKSISRIPAGEYQCVKRNSEKYGDHFHVLNVQDRKYILIHAGNYYINTKGCLLVGSGLKDINKDGLKDVTSSKKTMASLNKIMSEKFKIVIKNQFNV